MKLSDLTPKTVEFEVTGISLTFRPFTIYDDTTAQTICGGAEKVSEAITKMDFDKIFLMAWHQLTLESQKKVIKGVELVSIDPETGEEAAVKLTPIEKFKNLFLGIRDQTELLINLMRCRGLNIPDVEDGEAIKKWIDQIREIVPGLTGQ